MPRQNGKNVGQNGKNVGQNEGLRDRGHRDIGSLFRVDVPVLMIHAAIQVFKCLICLTNSQSLFLQLV